MIRHQIIIKMIMQNILVWNTQVVCLDPKLKFISRVMDSLYIASQSFFIIVSWIWAYLKASSRKLSGQKIVMKVRLSLKADHKPQKYEWSLPIKWLNLNKVTTWICHLTVVWMKHLEAGPKFCSERSFWLYHIKCTIGDNAFVCTGKQDGERLLLTRTIQRKL